jgi:hypothetical protein
VTCERRRSAYRVLVWVVVVGLGACAAPTDGPEVVARAFWEAIDTGDFEAARVASTEPTQRRLELLYGDRRFSAFQLGETLSNEDAAQVETTLVLERNERNPIRFDTHLVQREGAWRVHAEETASELRRAAFAAAVDDVQDSLREGQRVMSEALEEGAHQAAEALREAIEELDGALGPPPTTAP